jgi:ABC-2 type transport system permease protein
MKKILNLGWKDLVVLFRDRAALILILAAPFALTVGMALVTGRMTGGGGAISAIGVVVVDQDGGEISRALIDEVLDSPDLADLLDVTRLSDMAAARQLVEADQATAALIIPAGFSQSILSGENDPGSSTPQIELVANTGRPISVGVVQAILQAFLTQVEGGRVAGLVTNQQLLESGLLPAQEALQAGLQAGFSAAQDPAGGQVIAVRVNQADPNQLRNEPDLFLLLAPGFALMFLMFTVSLGGRSLLAERQAGTLQRLLATPTLGGYVLTGKMTGVYFTGVAQTSILILASVVLFRVSWGDPLAVALLILCTAAAATGWGMLLAALARTPNQVSSAGMALTLVFGLIGGGFTYGNLPGFLGVVGKITPNYWGLNGFIILAEGGSLQDLWLNLAVLLGMAAVLLTVSVLIFNRKGLLQR